MKTFNEHVDLNKENSVIMFGDISSGIDELAKEISENLLNSTNNEIVVLDILNKELWKNSSELYNKMSLYNDISDLFDIYTEIKEDEKEETSECKYIVIDNYDVLEDKIREVYGEEVLNDHREIMLDFIKYGREEGIKFIIISQRANGTFKRDLISNVSMKVVGTIVEADYLRIFGEDLLDSVDTPKNKGEFIYTTTSWEIRTINYIYSE